MSATSGWMEWANDLVYNKSDPRTRDWFLLKQPGDVLLIVALYIYFCVWSGPKYMKDKPPYELRKTLIAYNFMQVLLSMYLVYEGLMAGWLNEYSYTCQPIDFSESPSAMRMAGAGYMYFISKVLELLDTVFFVFRKKQRQVSFLHLYHHVSMLMLTWFGVRYWMGGHGTLFGVVNSFVHMFMYAYYMLTAFGESTRRFLWWKKYITILQIAQFILVGLHSAQVLFRECDYPKRLAALIMLQNVVFFYLFTSFYIETYVKGNARKAGTNDIQNGGSIRPKDN
ncbi:elongation of very long chain fatty acids protein-like [Athalia rosae]|uniref:elongation of very long chain fatty acids protein-like n=1 Tax=Athalia rosae TaxID=37344 RepID=UPI002034084F|nr:elongation of very long chain fatty acids protein-like [Athalia rosae]